MVGRFTLEYWVDAGWYVGRLKEVPGVFSQGENIEDIEANIIDACKMVIDESNVGKINSPTTKTKESSMPVVS